jgi:biotin carboxyl carrier protein
MTRDKAPVDVVPLGEGVYRVVENGRGRLVYVASARGGTWSFSNGRVFFVAEAAAASRPRRGGAHAAHALAAPMPATVIRVLVEPGSAVRKGDTVIVLEAMKMELPLRAAGDATVKAVNCREGELVQPDTVLVEFES